MYRSSAALAASAMALLAALSAAPAASAQQVVPVNTVAPGGAICNQPFLARESPRGFFVQIDVAVSNRFPVTASPVVVLLKGSREVFVTPVPTSPTVARSSFLLAPETGFTGVSLLGTLKACVHNPAENTQPLQIGIVAG